jgi:hypothetical protein
MASADPNPFPDRTTAVSLLTPYIMPTFTPQPEIIPKMDMVEAFALLASRWERTDLQLFSYSAVGVDTEGKSNNFQVVGYSAADMANYILDLKDNVIKLDRLDIPDVLAVKTFYGIERYRTIAALVADAMVLSGGRWDDVHGKVDLSILMINATVSAPGTDIGTYRVPYMEY